MFLPRSLLYNYFMRSAFFLNPHRFAVRKREEVCGLVADLLSFSLPPQAARKPGYQSYYMQL